MTPIAEAEVRRFLLFSGVPIRHVQAVKEHFTSALWNQAEPFLAGQSFYLCGPIGVGKTHLAAALTREWWLARPSRRPRFIIAAELLAKLRQRLSDNQPIDQTLAAASNCECLVLDDLGVERSTDWTAETLALIVDRRYRNCQQTLFTGNLPLDLLAKKLGDRTASRLSELCRIIVFDGQDRRRAEGEAA